MSLRKPPELLTDAIFGGADGMGIVLGLIAGLIVSHQSAHAVWVAALSSGVAELLSMANGKRLSDPDAGWLPPLVIGVASFAGCVIPAIPYALKSGPVALAASLVLAVGVAGVISWVRPEKGILAAVETFGLLILTGAACAACGLMT